MQEFNLIYVQISILFYFMSVFIKINKEKLFHQLWKFILKNLELKFH